MSLVAGESFSGHFCNITEQQELFHSEIALHGQKMQPPGGRRE